MKLGPAFTDSQNIGTVVALPVAPLLNDRLGRRWTLFIGSASTSHVLLRLFPANSQSVSQDVLSKLPRRTWECSSVHEP